MLKNYVTIAIRNLFNRRMISFINIFGLSFGMACFILITLWIADELSYDKFHENSDRLFRINTIEKNGVNPNSSLKLGKVMKDKFPEIEFYTNYIPWARSLLRYSGKFYDERNILLADPDFFNMFSFEFIYGSPSTSLKDKNSIIITERTAKKYFGDEYPLNKQVFSDFYQILFTVSGVIKNVPPNSTFQFDIAARIELMPQQRMESWEFSGQTFVLLKKGTDINSFNNKIKDFYKKYVDTEWESFPQLQNISAIHLEGNGEAEIKKLVYILSVIAIFILLIAFFNFINLSTAIGASRASEIGIRKVIGAQRIQIVMQFLIESIIIAIIAVLAAVIMVELILPSFNNFSFKKLCLLKENTILSILFLIIFAAISGVVAGAYPAFALSIFKPAATFKEKVILKKNGKIIRELLIICQFIIATILIICALIIQEQVQYIQNKDLGIQKDRILILENNQELNKKFDLYKYQLLNIPTIESVTASATLPVDVNQAIEVNWEGRYSEKPVLMFYTMVDYDYFSTLGFKFKSGRPFSTDYESDSTEACIINESALELMNFKDPVGKSIYFGHPAFPENARKLKIIGVVNNFNFRSLRNEIGPFVFKMYRPWHYNIFIKIKPNNISNTIKKVESITKKNSPDYPFSFEFLDDANSKLYILEIKTGILFNIFSAIAIIISCMGLFGLVAYMVEQKKKEIGIRKVLGSSVTHILYSFTWDVIKWILFANIIAWPIAYYLMNGWLYNFAYRIEIGWWAFGVSSILVLIIALITIIYQSIKVACENPVNSLRSE